MLNCQIMSKHSVNFSDWSMWYLIQCQTVTSVTCFILFQCEPNMQYCTYFHNLEKINNVMTNEPSLTWVFFSFGDNVIEFVKQESCVSNMYFWRLLIERMTILNGFLVSKAFIIMYKYCSPCLLVLKHSLQTSLANPYIG